MQSLKLPKSLPEQSLIVAQVSCRACGQRSRRCHAPCNRMARSPSKGSCHARCKQRFRACKGGRSCVPGKTVRIRIDLSGKSRVKKVSAKQARKIAISTRNQAVAATPPSIDDITAILRQQKPNAKRIAKLRKAADRKPPKTKSKSRLSKFYRDRGKAAGNIGRTGQELSDLQKALSYAKASKSRTQMYMGYCLCPLKLDRYLVSVLLIMRGDILWLGNGIQMRMSLIYCGRLSSICRLAVMCKQHVDLRV